MNKGVLYCWGLMLLIVVLFALNLLVGSVSIPASDVVRILLGDETEKALKMIDTALGIQERKDWRFLRDVILRRLDDKE